MGDSENYKTWEKCDDYELSHQQIKNEADMILPDNAFSNEAVEVYFHIAKEKAELLVIDLLTALREIDSLFQGYPNTDFEIGYINIYDDCIKIRYFALKYNDEFIVAVCKNKGQWCCIGRGIGLGMERYNPPLPITDLNRWRIDHSAPMQSSLFSRAKSFLQEFGDAFRK